CPKCKKAGLKRLIGEGAGIIFKGSGFYVTDYKKKPSPPKEGGEAKGSAEPKPAGAAEGKPAGGEPKASGKDPKK
ncbi:MAG: FmdB family zinc ribbon protein, partial [Opitutaceae bacterium]